MSRFFDALEERLRSSAAEQHADVVEQTAPPARRRRIRRRPLVAVAVAAGALAVPAVAAVTDVWRPDVKPAPPMRTTVTSGPSASCDVGPRRLDVGPPVGAAFTSVLGVLARPRSAADAFDRRYLRGPGLLGVDVQGIRFVGTAADGKRTFIVPARGFGQQPWPARCLRGLDGRQRRRLAHPPQRREPTVCMFSGGGGCSSLADVRTHGMFGSSGVVRGRATVAGIVPNGVRAVRITYGRSTRDFRVRENFFSFLVGIEAERALPDRFEWLMDDGSVRDVTR
ncbi:MAG TPA: hypothetical protein VF250_00415 [Conexibacter sp.]